MPDSPLPAFYTTLPAENAVARARLYAGDRYLLPPNAASLALTQCVAEQAVAVLQCQPSELPYAPTGDLYRRLAPVRAWLQQERAQLAPLLRTLLASHGYSPEEYIADMPRLRVVPPASTYPPTNYGPHTIHRDTWYANPMGQINVWLPLHPIAPTQSFVFYPHYFARAVTNNSAQFDYAHWQREIGWQATRTVPHDRYPQALQALPDAAAQSFSAPQAACLFFSSQHLHGTPPNPESTTRYSIDFRILHKGDAAQGIGAVNCDNDSKGDSSADYDYLVATQPEIDA